MWCGVVWNLRILLRRGCCALLACACQCKEGMVLQLPQMGEYLAGFKLSFGAITAICIYPIPTPTQGRSTELYKQERIRSKLTIKSKKKSKPSISINGEKRVKIVVPPESWGVFVVCCVMLWAARPRAGLWC